MLYGRNFSLYHWHSRGMLYHGFVEIMSFFIVVCDCDLYRRGIDKVGSDGNTYFYNYYNLIITMSLGGFIGSVFGSIFDKIFSWKVLKGVINSMMAHKAYWAK